MCQYLALDFARQTEREIGQAEEDPARSGVAAGCLPADLLHAGQQHPLYQEELARALNVIGLLHLDRDPPSVGVVAEDTLCLHTTT